MARRRVLPLLMNNGKPWNEASRPPPPPQGRVELLNTPYTFSTRNTCSATPSGRSPTKLLLPAQVYRLP